MSTETKPRESRMWWVLDNGMVRQVEGFAIEGEPNQWWLPELSYLGFVGYRIFATERAALARAITLTKDDMAKAQERLEGLLDRISKCPP